MVQYFPCLFGFLDARELEAVHSSKQNKHLTYEIWKTSQNIES